MRDYRLDYRRMNGTRLHVETASPERANALRVDAADQKPWCIGSWYYQIIGIDTPASQGLGTGYLVVSVIDWVDYEVVA